MTLEDVLEKIINIDIMDEDDYDEANKQTPKLFAKQSGSNQKVYSINLIFKFKTL